MQRLTRTVAGIIFFGAAAMFIGCGGAGNTRSDSPSSSSPGGASSARVEELDIVRSCELRSGPGNEYERKINQKASDRLGEVNYLSVDTSVTVKILQTQGDWAEIQVTQPDFLRDSHRGWVPRDVIKGGAATNKLDGWIRHTCRVYPAPDKSTKPVGYLSPPSSVGVADDGSAWLRLLHGPVKSETTGEFLDISFDPGVYIEKSNFTTALPANWNR